jgi:carbamoyltransferase
MMLVGPRKLYLGLSFGHSDPAVALVEHGRVLAFVEEERLSREKHAIGQFPRRALAAVLTEARARPCDVSAVAVSWNLPSYADGRMQRFYDAVNRRYGSSPGTLQWQAKTIAGYNAPAIREVLRVKAGSLLPEDVPIRSFGHHFVHALQVASQSPFDNALVLTLDGSGDKFCSVAWTWQDGKLRRLRTQPIPHSLGWFYAAITEYLGFAAYDGEQKVMAMAAFGRADTPLRDVINRVLKVRGGKYAVDGRYLHQGAHSHSGRFTDALVHALAVLPRKRSAPFEQHHFDLAAAAQAQLEAAVIAFACKPLAVSGARAICVGGGVALNVRLAGALQQAFGVPVFTYPLAHDGGSPLGAALAAWRRATGSKLPRLTSLALGCTPTCADLHAAIAQAVVAGQRVQPLATAWSALANSLVRGGIVGWFQGRMEGGPRALGYRSLFCDPVHAGAVARITADVKQREEWQPYGVSVAAHDSANYFQGAVVSDWMSIAVPVTNRFRAEAPYAVHRDGTTRPHLVHADVQPRLAQLLNAFRSRTGRGVLINTSLNQGGQPIVCTPAEALALFSCTPLSALVIEDRVLWRDHLTETNSL